MDTSSYDNFLINYIYHLKTSQDLRAHIGKYIQRFAVRLL